MIRAVLDTNTIVSGLGWGGTPGAVLDAALAGQFDLITSIALLDELQRVLTYPKLQAVIGQPSGLVELITLAAIVGEPPRPSTSSGTPTTTVSSKLHSPATPTSS
ncbi:MAG: putative toxin-antitoxin system toxin component, PIN family [Nitriliruptor sp.]